MNNLYLAHHGVKGQKWGVRRYTNSDGTLNSVGKHKLKSLERQNVKNRSKAEIHIGKGNADIMTAKGYKILANNAKTESAKNRYEKKSKKMYDSADKHYYKAFDKYGSKVHKTSDESYDIAEKAKNGKDFLSKLNTSLAYSDKHIDTVEYKTGKNRKAFNHNKTYVDELVKQLDRYNNGEQRRSLDF